MALLGGLIVNERGKHCSICTVKKPRVINAFLSFRNAFITRNVNAKILRHSKRSCKAYVLAEMACFGRVIICFN
jgi:hypothetical protein